jgi:hypothetical protein
MMNSPVPKICTFTFLAFPVCLPFLLFLAFPVAFPLLLFAKKQPHWAQKQPGRLAPFGSDRIPLQKQGKGFTGTAKSNRGAKQGSSDPTEVRAKALCSIHTKLD